MSFWINILSYLHYNLNIIKFIELIFKIIIYIILITIRIISDIIFNWHYNEFALRSSYRNSLRWLEIFRKISQVLTIETKNKMLWVAKHFSLYMYSQIILGSWSFIFELDCFININFNMFTFDSKLLGLSEALLRWRSIISSLSIETVISTTVTASYSLTAKVLIIFPLGISFISQNFSWYAYRNNIWLCQYHIW
jgi:hypothetical protein